MQPKRRQKDRPRRSFFRPPPAGVSLPPDEVTGRRVPGPHKPKPSPLMGRGVEWRTPVSLPLAGSAVLNDTPVACQIREPPDPRRDRWHGDAETDEGSPQTLAFPLRGRCPRRGRMRCPPSRPQAYLQFPRRHQPPPTHCGASRRNGRDLIIATRPAHQPLPSLLSAAAAQEVQAIPEPTTMSPTAPIPRDQHRQICTCPPRAKGSLDRRSKRLSFPHFFLRRKKCGRRRPPPRQGKIDSPPQRRNPPRAKGFLNRRFEWFSLVTFF